MFTAAFACRKPSLLQRPFLCRHLSAPRPARALGILLLNAQCRLLRFDVGRKWWIQDANPRSFTERVFYKEKDVLPERLDLKALINTSRLLITHAGVQLARAIPKEGCSASFHYPRLQPVAQEGCCCGSAAKNTPSTQSWKSRLSLQSKHNQFNQVRMWPVPSRRERK